MFNVVASVADAALVLKYMFVNNHVLLFKPMGSKSMSTKRRVSS
jgi:hypothetical protein